MPNLRARPERGRTCPSNPGGISNASPVGTAARAPGAMSIGSSAAEARSSPAAPADMYFGASAPGRSFTNRMRGAEALIRLRGGGAEVVHDVGGLPDRLAAGEANLAGGAVDADGLHQHLVAFLADVAHHVDALLVELADVDQAVGAGEDLHEGAEVGQPLAHAHVELAHLRLGGEPLDYVDRLLDRDPVGRGDVDGAVILDLDRDARLRRD